MRPEEKTFRTADGDEFTFLFTHRAMIAAENAADAPFAKVVGGAGEGRLGHLAALILGGLREHHPSLTLDDTLAMIDGPDGEALGKALWPALQSALPEQKKAAKANPRKAAGGTGSPSLPRGARKASTKPASGDRRPAAIQ